MIILDDSISKESVSVYYGKRLINLGYTLTKHKSVYFKKTFGCIRFIYNYFLDRRIKAYEQN